MTLPAHRRLFVVRIASAAALYHGGPAAPSASQSIRSSARRGFFGLGGGGKKGSDNPPAAATAAPSGDAPGGGKMPDLSKLFEMANELQQKAAASGKPLNSPDDIRKAMSESGMLPKPPAAGAKPPSPAELKNMMEMAAKLKTAMEATGVVPPAAGGGATPPVGSMRMPSLKGTMPPPLPGTKPTVLPPPASSKGPSGASPNSKPTAANTATGNPFSTSGSASFASQTSFGSRLEKGLGGQLNMMRQLIEIQRMAAMGDPTKPPTLWQRFLRAQTNFFVKFVDWQQRRLDRKQGRAPAAAGASFTSATAPPSSSGAAAASSGAATADSGNRTELDKEIEALFAELRQVREKRNDYRNRLAAKESELEQKIKELSQVRDSEADLRKRLGKVEKDLMLVSSEALQLRDSEKKAKQLQREVTELRAAVDSKQSAQLSSAVSEKVAELSSRLQHAEAELTRQQRKVQRARRQNPLLQFMEVLGSATTIIDQSAFHNHRDSTDAASDMFADAPAVGDTDAAESLRQSYERELIDSWPEASARLGAPAALSHACKLIASRVVPQSNLDAVVDFESAADAARFSQYVTAHCPNWQVVPWASAVTSDQPATSSSAANARSSHTLVVTAKTLVDGDGPFGVLYCAAAEQQAGSLTSPQLPRLAGVRPMISKALVENTSRSRIDVERSRSAAPGGQAANVSETQVTLKLFVDGVLVARSESQETRSALSNHEAATRRLHEDHLQKLNDDFKKPVRLRLAAKSNFSASGGEAAGGGAETVSEQQWTTFVAPAAGMIKDPLEQATIAQVRKWVVQ